MRFEHLALTQSALASRLGDELETGRLPQSLLFYGPQGSSRMSAAIELALSLTGQEDAFWSLETNSLIILANRDSQLRIRALRSQLEKQKTKRSLMNLVHETRILLSAYSGELYTNGDKDLFERAGELGELLYSLPDPSDGAGLEAFLSGFDKKYEAFISKRRKSSAFSIGRHPEAARKRSGIYAYGRRQRLLGKRRHGAYDFVKIRLACDVAAGNADHDFAPKPAHGIVKNLRVVDSNKPLAHFFSLKRRGRQLLQKLKLCAVIARSHAAQSAAWARGDPVSEPKRPADLNAGQRAPASLPTSAFVVPSADLPRRGFRSSAELRFLTPALRAGAAPSSTQGAQSSPAVYPEQFAQARKPG